MSTSAQPEDHPASLPRSPIHTRSMSPVQPKQTPVQPIHGSVPPRKGYMQTLRNLAPSLLVTAAIIAIVAVGYSLRSQASAYNQIASKVSTLYNTAQKGFDAAKESMTERQQEARSMFDAAAKRTQKAQENLKRAMEEMKQHGTSKTSDAYLAAKKTYEEAQSAVADGMQTMQEYWDQWNDEAAEQWDRATSSAVEMWENMKRRFSLGKDETGDKQKRMYDTFSKLGDKLSESYEATKRASNELKEHSKDRSSQAYYKAKHNYDKAKMQLEDYLDKVHDLYSDYSSSAKDSISDMLITVRDYGTSIYEAIACPTCNAESAIQKRLKEQFEQVNADVLAASGKMADAAVRMKRLAKHPESKEYRTALEDFEEAQNQVDAGSARLEELYDEWNAVVNDQLEDLRNKMTERYEKLKEQLTDQHKNIRQEFDSWSKAAAEKSRQIDEYMQMLKKESNNRGSAAYKRTQERLRQARDSLNKLHRKMRKAFDRWVE